MDISKTLYVTDPKVWRRWLRQHHNTENEIWLVYYKKGTGKPRIDYNAAVEEALCFGWIDSTVKSIDSERTAQRFSPRKPRSKYSAANLERLRKLVEQRKVIKEIRETIEGILGGKLDIPEDILNAIKANGAAWQNFQKFSDSYKRIRIGFIEGARGRPQEYRKRLAYFIKMTEKNKLYGFGGIEKHF